MSKDQIKKHDWYDSNLIIELLKYYLDNQTAILETLDTQDALSQTLENLDHNKSKFIIPLNVRCTDGGLGQNSNHWVALYITRNDSSLNIVYIDPMGRKINKDLEVNLRANPEYEISEPLFSSGIQFIKSSDELEIKGNINDCGPMLIYAIICYNCSLPLPKIKNEPDSNALGQYLRNAFSKKLDFDEIYNKKNQDDPDDCDDDEYDWLESGKQKSKATEDTNTSRKSLAGLVKKFRRKHFKQPKKKVKFFNGDEADHDTKIDTERSSLSKSAYTKSIARYILNPIMHVPTAEEYYYSDSSDEELDDEDFNAFKNLDESHFPFKIDAYAKTARAKYIKFLDLNSVFSIRARDAYSEYNQESQVIDPFLETLEKTALGESSSLNLADTVKASLFLNKPVSVSTRENSSLWLEHYSMRTSSEIDFSVISKFWCPSYLNTETKTTVEFFEIRKYYKKLKKYDKKQNTHLAPIFLNSFNALHSFVPYQELREEAKNTPATQGLVSTSYQNAPNSPHYMLFCDRDTVSYNGIIDAYEKIIKEAIESYDKTPTIITTGYEFSKENKTDNPLVVASKLSREIQVEIGKHNALLNYFPEPNLLILIPLGYNTVSESFIDKKRVNFESGILLCNIIKNRDDLLAIFSAEAPLITAIPTRCRYYKNLKNTLLEFSLEFILGSAPTRMDVNKFNFISQSKTCPMEIASSTHSNRAFKLNGNFRQFKKIIYTLLTSEIPHKESSSRAHDALQDFIKDVDDRDCLITAMLAVKKLLYHYKDTQTAEPQFEEATSLLESMKINIIDLSLDLIELISEREVLELLKKEVIDIDELISLHCHYPDETAKIFNEPTAINYLQNNSITLDKLKELVQLDHYLPELLDLYFYDDCTIEQIRELANTGEFEILRDFMRDNNIEVDDALELYNAGSTYFLGSIEFFSDVGDALHNGYSISEIIDKYKEDEFHLIFMSNSDNVGYVLEHHDDEVIVKFAVDNDYIDEDNLKWVYGELNDYEQQDFANYFGWNGDYNDF